MARPVPAREKRRQTFLRALAAGTPVVQACAASGLAFSTVYSWRNKHADFRAAWDAAARAGVEALTGRFESELVRRAIDGVDEPVFHNGEVVGERRRWSDPLLMFGLRELRAKSPSGPQPFVTRTPKVTVMIEPLGDHGAADDA